MPPDDVPDVDDGIGLRAFDKAASNMAECLVCKSKVMKNTWRFEWRTKKSSSLRDQKKLHVECLQELTVREQDIKKVRAWRSSLEAEGRDDGVAVLDGVLASY